jgi:Rrf2 family protein
MAIGQLFSQRFGYAVHALCFMARRPSGKLTTLPEIADWMQSIWSDASPTYLSAVMQRLARGGVIRSHRGVAGGYSLSKPAAEINLRELTELLEGVQVERCGLSLQTKCPVQFRCAIPRTLRSVEERFLDLLNDITIEQLARQGAIRPRSEVPDKP